jgi:outer membrane protein OmpA-like peptidoglycan-associated protein
MRITCASRLTTAAAAGLAAFGCTTTTPALVGEVRSEYQATASDPEVAKYGAVELYEAQQAVDRLEREVDDGDSDLEQLAYVARRRIEIAREAAGAGEATARLEELARRRNEVRLDARTAQVEAAEEEAARARAVARSALERAEQLEADLNAKETERGLVLTMTEDVLFAFDQAELQPGATQALSEVARFLNEYPERRVAVEGHTDSVGTSAYNQDLSQRRAAAVAGFLRAHGVEAGRLQVAGFGETLPVSPNDTEAGRQMNRRVEIILSNPPVASPPPGRTSLR